MLIILYFSWPDRQLYRKHETYSCTAEFGFSEAWENTEKKGNYKNQTTDMIRHFPALFCLVWFFFSGGGYCWYLSRVRQSKWQLVVDLDTGASLRFSDFRAFINLSHTLAFWPRVAFTRSQLRFPTWRWLLFQESQAENPHQFVLCSCSVTSLGCYWPKPLGMCWCLSPCISLVSRIFSHLQDCSSSMDLHILLFGPISFLQRWFLFRNPFFRHQLFFPDL